MEIHTGLSYGDILLVPQRSPIDSWNDVNLSISVMPDLRLDTPLVSAAMGTVIEAELAGTLSGLDGFGVVHRFLNVDKQVEQVRRIAEADGAVAGAVGISEDYLDRAKALLNADAGAIVVDIAHGRMELCLDAVERVRDEFGPEIIAGSVVMPAAVEDLWEAGAGCVGVGVGPGSHCTAREATGADYPQLTAVSGCTERAYNPGIHVMADGGIRTSGDATKAPMVGTDTVTMGSFFAGTDEALGRVVEADGKTHRHSRGMASTEAADDREDKQGNVDAGGGVEAPTPYKGPVGPLVGGFLGGIRSDVGYCDGHALAGTREKASFIHVAASAKERGGAHGVVFVEGPVKVDGEVEHELQVPMAD